jgi:hypothetical protein
MKDKNRLSPIMEIEGVGVAALVSMPHPAQTFSAEGDDLKKFLWKPPNIIKWLLKKVGRHGT